MDIRSAFESQPHSPEWLTRYLEFLDTVVAPGVGPRDRHHILPKAVFPRFVSLRYNPWNKAILRPADHLLAHYFLMRALPECQEMRWAFKFMVGRHYLDLVEQGYDLPLVQEIADAYQRVREGNQNSPCIRGWKRLYYGETRATVVPPDSEALETLLAQGWTTEPPERQWVTDGTTEKRVYVSKVSTYAAQGWRVGRIYKHPESYGPSLSARSLRFHEQERSKAHPYTYLPTGDEHPRRITGISEATKAKISRALTGRKQDPTQVETRRLKLVGQRKPWTQEARRHRSDQLRGTPPTSGMTFAGCTHSEEFKARRSAEMKALYAENPEHPTFTNKPSGADHWTYGKARPAETRDKISAALKGKAQTAATKQKRADALALARLPAYTEEEIALFDALRAGNSPPFKLTALSKGAQAVVHGLRLLLSGTATDENHRYWRQAANWLRLTGR